MEDKFHINWYYPNLSYQGPFHDPKISLKSISVSIRKIFGFMKNGHFIFIICFIFFVTGFENLTVANSDNSEATTEKAKNAKYDRTTLGMKKRFLCLREYVDDKGNENFPSNREIDTFIKNVTQLEFISASSVTSGTDTKKISHFQLHKLGLSKTSIATHKKAFVDLVNYEGTNDEYCTIKKRAKEESGPAAEAAAQKRAEEEVKLAAEAAAQKRAEEQAKLAAEAAAQKRVEEKAKLVAEAASQKRVEEKAKLAAEAASQKTELKSTLSTSPAKSPQGEDFQHVYLVPKVFGVNSLAELDGAIICVMRPYQTEFIKALASSMSIKLKKIQNSSFEDFASGVCDVAVVDADTVNEKDKLVKYHVFNQKNERLYPEGISLLADSFIEPGFVSTLITGEDGIPKYENHKSKVCEYENGYMYKVAFNPNSGEPTCQKWIWHD